MSMCDAVCLRRRVAQPAVATLDASIEELSARDKTYCVILNEIVKSLNKVPLELPRASRMMAGCHFVYST